MFKEAEIKINEKFRDIDYRISTLEDNMKYPNFHGYVNPINVTLIDENNYEQYYNAIDDIFISYLGNHYMKVNIDGVFMEINIDKIISVYNIYTDQDSKLVKNWVQIKLNIQRGEKFKRIIDDEI